MTEAAPPPPPPADSPAPKRRKLSNGTSSPTAYVSNSPDHPQTVRSSEKSSPQLDANLKAEHITPKTQPVHPNTQETPYPKGEEYVPTMPGNYEQEVVRGPVVTTDLDEVRPPRRVSPSETESNPEPTDTQVTVKAVPDKNFSPEVDAELGKALSSGLFDRRDIDGRALDFLEAQPPHLALAALYDIQRRDFSTVRNKPAFIMSIFKRVVAGNGSAHPPPPPQGGYPPTSVPADVLAHLPPAVSDALQRVFAAGVCLPSQFDDRAMDILVDLSKQEADAVRALSEFAAMEPGRVRNPSAFWMGLAKKYKGHARAPGGRIGADSSYGYDRSSASYSNGALDQRLEELATAGSLPRGALDDRALDALRRLPEHDGLAVLAELPEPSRVRNMSAYVMGLCKKFASGEARSLANRGGTYGAAYGANTSYAAYGVYGHSYNGNAYPVSTATYANTQYASAAIPGSYAAYGMPIAAGGYSTGVAPQPDQTRVRDTRKAMDSMDPTVRDRLYSMINQGILTETSLDARAIAALQNMRSEHAVAALDELAASEPSRIHNISAYFMGLAKKFSGHPM